MPSSAPGPASWLSLIFTTRQNSLRDLPHSLHNLQLIGNVYFPALFNLYRPSNLTKGRSLRKTSIWKANGLCQIITPQRKFIYCHCWPSILGTKLLDEFNGKMEDKLIFLEIEANLQLLTTGKLQYLFIFVNKSWMQLFG